LKSVKKLPEVKSAKLNIVESVVHVYDWLEKEVEKKGSLASLEINNHAPEPIVCCTRLRVQLMCEI
jgi:hypothetical protein